MSQLIARKRCCSLLIVCAGLLSLTCAVGGQARPAAGGFVPMPDPGYGLYYRDTGAPNVAARWGYHDGWSDGRRDRNRGETSTAREKEQYKTPPEHGGHLGVTRDVYVRAYREAYTHGYEHGTRI